MNTFITITLNDRIYYLSLIQISFLSIFLWSVWSTFLCFPILLDSLYFYVLNEIAISSSLKGVVLCRQWSILFNHTLVLGCLSSVSPTGLFIWETHCPFSVLALTTPLLTIDLSWGEQYELRFHNSPAFQWGRLEGWRVSICVLVWNTD